MTAIPAPRAASDPVEPRWVADLDDETYHADRSTLSSTGARLLLPPGCPALFRHRLDHPGPAKDWADLGHVFHSLVLGTGHLPKLIDHELWNSNAIKAEVAAAREAGFIPLKRKAYDQAVAMRDAAFRDPIAGPLLARDGAPELSLYWTDPASGVPCRARPDKLTDLAMVDLKSAADPSPRGFEKASAEHGYYQQDPWYADAVEAVFGERLPMLFVVVGKEPPHLVTVHQLRDGDIAVGAARNARARDVYAACVADDRWPGWGDQIHAPALPRWVTA